MRTSTGPGRARFSSAACAAGSRSPSRANRSRPAVTSSETLALFGPGVSNPSGPAGHNTSQDRPGPALRCSPATARSNGTCAVAAHPNTRASSPGGASKVVVSIAPTARPRSTPGRPSL
ncbi:hypothetical protein [Kitasatospora sp. MAA4]|uniref:hypothetical protein n=1 Tax=Kitasatospora sp. MAA4 TaxID=3035093 RepID=UPI0024755052|nr:hypothetical protein [Kitasatospora sp. MAA4]